VTALTIMIVVITNQPPLAYQPSPPVLAVGRQAALPNNPGTWRGPSLACCLDGSHNKTIITQLLNPLASMRHTPQLRFEAWLST
jgi:hypothetical protein